VYPPNNYYKHIDGLRALAVSSVFLCHLDFPLFSGGFVGVDVFFVISGFLITNIIIQQLESTSGFSFLNFYARRIKRIFPALFFTLFCSFIAGILLLNPASFKLLGNSLACAALSLSNLFFKNQAGYFDIFSQSNPLLHTWSLGVEEQFYMFFPLILFFWHKLFKRTWVIILILFILSFILNLYYQNSEPVGLYYLVHYRAFEFCMGAFIVFLMRYELHSYVKEILCFLGMILIINALFTYNSNTLFPSYNALMPCIGAALILYSGNALYTGSILRCLPVRQIGLMSYSLYLIHWPLIIFFKTYHQNCGSSFNLNFNEKMALLGLALLGSFFMYSFIEQPFRKKGSLPLKPIIQGLSFACLISFLGVFISQSDGWLWRVNAPNELLKMDDLTQYHLTHWGGAGFSGGFIHKGKTNYAQIVMMGDSHTGMLDEGMVQKIARPLELTVFTVSGGGAGAYASSLLLPGLTRLDKNQKIFDDSAGQGYKEALKKVHATKEQSILILSAAWSMQLHTAAYLKNHRPLHIDPSSMSSYRDYKPFLNALDKLLKGLGRKKLIIIGDVPGSQYNPINCLGVLKWFKQSDCSLRDDEHLNQGALNINKILALYASKRRNVYFLNPYEVFCKRDYCNSVDPRGDPYYSDGSHLSKIGSKFLMAHLKPKIMEVLNS
jgi:peptidoglycan/LPS O-acetylase OafA/YrhL